MAIPTITIGSPSRAKISSVNGYDQATVTFQSDMALHNWEARATQPNAATGHGTGLLVESGGSLAANTDATVYVDDEELTQGDLEYTITVFGHGEDGYWSDGTYEGINVFDPDRDVILLYYVSIVGKNLLYEIEKTPYSAFTIDLYLDDEWQRNAFTVYEDGNYSFILRKDESFDLFNILIAFDGGYAVADVNASIMENGFDYQFSFSVRTISQNQVLISDILIKKVVV